jgi:hypothetical protein
MKANRKGAGQSHGDLKLLSPQTIFFILSLAILSTLIWLLSLISSIVSNIYSKRAGEPANEGDTSNELQDNTKPQQGIATIANAIDAHRRSPQSQERDRSKREYITIAVLGATALFAFLAAVAAIYSAWIFSGQLSEMHQASVDTADLVKTARETEERQLRAYVGFTGDVLLRCRSCDVHVYRPFTPSAKHIADNTISFNLRNGGQTPAYNTSFEASFYYAPYGQGIPSGFTYPIINGAYPLFSGSLSTENPIASIGPRDTMPSEIPIHPSAIPEIISARQHDISLFFYGNIRYTDVFKKTVSRRSVSSICLTIPKTSNW